MISLVKMPKHVLLHLQAWPQPHTTLSLPLLLQIHWPNSVSGPLHTSSHHRALAQALFYDRRLWVMPSHLSSSFASSYTCLGVQLR